MSVVCEASGMLGQQYVESMVWEVSKWCMRSAMCCVSGVGVNGMWCGGRWYVEGIGMWG